MMMEIDRQFVAAARSYLGVPWVRQGRSRQGVDCIGLVVLAARDCGMNVTMAATYGDTQAYWEMKPILIEHCARVGYPGEGIIVLYKNPAILHLGVLTAEGTVIHAFGPKNKVVESGLNFPPKQYWRPRWPS